MHGLLCGVISAHEIARVTATKLHGEFATVVDPATLLRCEQEP